MSMHYFGTGLSLVNEDYNHVEYSGTYDPNDETAHSNIIAMIK